MISLRRLVSIVFTSGLVGCASPPIALRAVPEVALELRFLDVGQGDAVLISLGRQVVLVDASGGDDIVLLLAEYQVDSLVAVVASHHHDDHIGGMDAVIADHPIGRYFSNGRPPESRSAANVERWLTERKVARPQAPWRPFHLGDATITLLPPPMNGVGVSENNSSVGVLIERGGFRALLTGDSEVEELNAWLKAGVIPDVDLLKAVVLRSPSSEGLSDRPGRHGHRVSRSGWALSDRAGRANQAIGQGAGRDVPQCRSTAYRRAQLAAYRSTAMK